MAEEETMDGSESRLTRQDLLARGAKGALALGAAGAWLGGVPGAEAAKRLVAAAPKRGGTFTVGMISGGPSETINPGLAISWPDTVRVFQLYDLLFTVSPDVKTALPALATSAEPNKKATVWTIHLRHGIEFHNGRPFTADDVVWTMKSWASKTNFANPWFAGMIDFGRVRKVGRLTVEVPLHVPVAQFPSMLTGYNMAIIQNGASQKDVSQKGIGTGPYTMVSFKPGQHSLFKRNPNYWQHGKPYVDTFICDSSFTDQTARVNALLGGQINVAPAFPFTNAVALAKNKQVQILQAPGPNDCFFPMRVDKGPFADNRVRLAMRLIVDRPAMINGAFSGLGTVANDLFGQDTEYYASSLPQRHQDIEHAKHLLKAAGHAGLTFNFPTADALPGFIEATTLFAAEAAKAGVKVNVQTKDAGTYYTPAGGFTTRPISVDQVPTTPSLTFAYRNFFVPKAYVDETHWGDSHRAANKLLTEAVAATDPHRAEQLWLEVQKLQYEQGGCIVWGASNYVDAAANNVHGLKTTKASYLNNMNFNDGWIE